MLYITCCNTDTVDRNEVEKLSLKDFSNASQRYVLESKVENSSELTISEAMMLANDYMFGGNQYEKSDYQKAKSGIYMQFNMMFQQTPVIP